MGKCDYGGEEEESEEWWCGERRHTITVIVLLQEVMADSGIAILPARSLFCISSPRASLTMLVKSPIRAFLWFSWSNLFVFSGQLQYVYV